MQYPPIDPVIVGLSLCCKQAPGDGPIEDVKPLWEKLDMLDIVLENTNILIWLTIINKL